MVPDKEEDQFLDEKSVFLLTKAGGPNSTMLELPP
jgi:hypothetical protein